MERKMIVPNSAAKILVMVNDVDGDEISGTWKAISKNSGGSFYSYLDLVLKIDKFYDQCKMMAPSTIDRCFSKSINKVKEIREEDSEMDDMIFVNENGERATFVIQVMFRQNSTWQGTIKWLEDGRETQFRSTLELLKIMNDAMNHEEVAKAGTI